MRKKRITSEIYTYGKFGKRLRETLDCDNPFLYSKGVYPTKITADDLPEDYLEIRSRSIWYMTGFLKTSGIKDMEYIYRKENHLFKDDYIYISYKEELKSENNEYGFKEFTNYDVRICGNDIINIVLAAEKYSGFNTEKIRAKIEEKRVWLRDNEPFEYEQAVGENRDIFDLWIENRYVDPKLI